MHLNTLLDQNVVVLTASRRLAHAVRLGYARHAQQQGLTIWRTPRVLPWLAWLREQWREARAMGRQPLPRLLTSAQARVLWGDVVASSACGAALLNPASAARLAARSWRRMHEYRIPFKSLAGADSAEAQALHQWCSEFVRRCEAMTAFDEAQLPAWALQQQLAPQDSVTLAGFDLVPPALAELVSLWTEQRKFVSTAAGVSKPADICVVGARDAEAELDLAARWARNLIERQSGSVGILIADLQTRSDDVRRVFADVFAPGARMTGADPAAAPVVIAAPQLLSGYPLVDAAVLILRLAAGQGDSVLTGRILRSVFTAGGVTERDARARADFRLREEQRERCDWFELERRAGIAGAAQLQLAARSVGRVLRAESSPAAPSRWVERFHMILTVAGWPGERTLNSVEQQTLSKFQAALAEFGALDAVLPRLSFREALSHLQDLLRDTPFEAESPNAPVTVIDPATACGMTFDALWVMGLEANRLPGAANPDPLIPVELQRAAGVPEASADGMLKLALTQFDRWLTSAPSVVLSWPKREGDAELERSPLLMRWPVSEAANLERAATRSLRQTLFDNRPALESFRDEQAPALAASAARGGAAILELQSRCPFRAQAQIRLHAQATPTIAVGVDPRRRGDILHRVLAEVWGKLREQTALASTDAAALGAQVRSITAREAAHVLRASSEQRARLASLEVDSVVRQVLRLLSLEKERPPFRVRFAEAAEVHEIGGLALSLRPDRIDELAGGGELLIDYKLGGSNRPRDWLDVWPGRPRHPQLPLYALAHTDKLSALAFVVLAPGAVEYRGWSNGAAVGAGVRTYPSGVSLRSAVPMDWEALLIHWRRTLEQLATQYVAGDARVDPLPQECRYCHLSTLCRIHEQLQSRHDGQGNGEGGDDD